MSLPDVQVYTYMRVCVGVSVNGRWGAYDVMQINLDGKFSHPSFILINYQNKEYGECELNLREDEVSRISEISC